MMKQKIRQLLLHTYCKSFLSKRSKKIKCEKTTNIEYKGIASSVLYYLKSDKGNFYLKECKRHKDIGSYVGSLIDMFVEEFVDANDKELFKKEIFNKLSNKNNYRKFINMGMQYVKNTPMWEYQNGGGTEVVGLPELNKDIVKYSDLFIRYSANALDQYTLNSVNSRNSYNLFSASKILATKKIADLMGIGYLVPDSMYFCLEENTEKRVFMGVREVENCYTNIDGGKLECFITPIVQRDLSNIELLDLVCCHMDHGPHNLAFIEKDKVAIETRIFDNDAPSAFLPVPIGVVKQYENIERTIVSGEFNRPYISVQAYNRILDIGRKDIMQATESLSKIERVMTWHRLCSLRTCIKKAVDEKRVTVLLDGDWSKETCDFELSNYGRTLFNVVVGKSNGIRDCVTL